MTSRPRASEAIEDAIVGVIAEHGLEGTSVRRVAARAGVSIGAVQHYFPTKDAMLAAAMARVEEVYRRRLAEETGHLSDRPDAMLRAVLHSLVPRTAEDRPDTSLWLAFVARAVVHDATAQQHQEAWQRAEDGLARLIMACSATTVNGERDETALPEPTPRARDAAAELLALADGLAIASAIEPHRMPPERARRVLDAAADGALNPGGQAG